VGPRPLEIIIEEAGGLFFAFDGSRSIRSGTAIGCAPGIVDDVRQTLGVGMAADASSLRFEPVK
jgi:hypothetical protein